MRDSDARLSRLKVVAIDVDGVLTDGKLHYGAAGEEQKVFHVHDGAGIKALLAAGIEVAVVTGRGGPALERRMKDLGIVHVITGCDDKWPAIEAQGFDLPFQRLWTYYLSYCEAGFLAGRVDVGLYRLTRGT